MSNPSEGRVIGRVVCGLAGSTVQLYDKPVFFVNSYSKI